MIRLLGKNAPGDLERFLRLLVANTLRAQQFDRHLLTAPDLFQFLPGAEIARVLGQHVVQVIDRRGIVPLPALALGGFQLGAHVFLPGKLDGGGDPDILRRGFLLRLERLEAIGGRSGVGRGRVERDARASRQRKRRDQEQ
ncbi:hypothetical protein [Burkholderia stabilis]|uniref:hypothetical protein n=1 Tax=Burkholderia stabilis TaxID=95485 RepID=UPI001F4B660D|nr:hypothetical protein [Burkholderia stabilis]